MSAPVAFGLLVASNPDDDLGVVEQEVVDPQVEAVGVGVSPQEAKELMTGAVISAPAFVAAPKSVRSWAAWEPFRRGR